MTLIEEDMPDFFKQIMSQVMLEVRTENEAVELLHTLRQILRLSFKKSIYFLGENEKSRQKISKARNSYARIAQGEMPLICFDNTALGTAHDGCLVTTRGVYVHNPMENVNFFDYKMFVIAEVRGTFIKDVYINDYKLDTNCMYSDDKDGFAELINLFVKDFSGEDSMYSLVMNS